MAIKHLANISLEGNEIQNVKLHPLAASPSGAEGQVFYNTATNKLMLHNGSVWYSVNGDVESVGIASGSSAMLSSSGGENPEISVLTAAITNGGATLATADQIYDFVQTQIGAIADSDTTYSVSVEAGGGNSSIIRLTAGGSGSGTDDITISGTTGEIEVTESGDTITVGLPNDVTIGNDLTVNGDLIVNGTTTSVNSNEVNIGDNIIVLNADETGVPSQNAGIEVERGTSTNVQLRFNEGSNRWEFTNDGATYQNIPVANEFNPTIGTDTDLTTSGATVVDDISITDGVITSHTTRTLTLGNLGFTGDTNANNYVHPSYAGDDISIDTGALSGASVISDIDLNVTTDAQGHVTDANATIATRNLTPSDIGAQVAGTYNTVIGTDTDLNTSGIEVVDQINVTDGVIQSMSKRSIDSASTTGKGVVELATNTEAIAGTDTTRAVTPAGVAAAIGNIPSEISTSNHNSYLIGNGSDTTLTVTHNWNTKNIMVQVVEEASGETIFAEVARPTVNTVTVGFASAPASNTYRVHLIKTVY